MKQLGRVKYTAKFHVQEINAYVLGNVREQVKLIRPHIGVVTTIGSDHYSVYRNLEATAREKGFLVEALPKSGVAILNADDTHVKSMASRTSARVCTFGRSSEADVRAENVSGVWPDRLSLTVTYNNQNVRVETQLVGEHWVASILAAIAAGVACGLELRTCAEAVKEVEPTLGRYSVHIRNDGAAFILDTHKAPHWTIADGLSFVRAARARYKTIVFGTISDYPGANSPRYRRVARDALSVADRVIFVGPMSSHVANLREGDARDRLLTFETAYQASVFLKENIRPNEMIYMKASLVADHLERIMLSQLDEVVCWRERCEQEVPCPVCKLYAEPSALPLGLEEHPSSGC